MAIRAALSPAHKPISHRAGPAHSRHRLPAAFVALSLALTGLSATGALLQAEPAVAAPTAVIKTFTSAAGENWTVPTGVRSITATVTGASGGSGGAGHSLTGSFTVTPGETLRIWGSTAGGPVYAHSPGAGGAGYAAGGRGGGDDGQAHAGGGGGGASAIERSGVAEPLLVAAGGGGAGGKGGGSGCQGGLAGAAGQDGAKARGCRGPGAGGAAGASTTKAGTAGGSSGWGSSAGGAGGGGGGYPTGGKGGAAGYYVFGDVGSAGGGGGGGGMSFAAAEFGALTPTHAAAGNGSVVLSYTPSYTTTTTLTASPSSTVIGAPITFTASVAGEVASTAGNPLSGTVSFLGAGDSLLAGPVAIDAAGTASSGALLLPLTATSVKAVFTPAADSLYQGSTRSAAFTVSKGSTTTALSVSPVPAELGEQVTATITVTPVAPAVATLDGTVELRDALDNLIGTSTAFDAGGVATITFTPTSLDPLTLTANYLGGTSFLSSFSDPTDLTIDKASSLLELSQSADSSVWGEEVTLTAEVSAAGAAPQPAVNRSVAPPVPSGTVTFYADGIPLATVDVDGGAAGLDVDDLEVGVHTLSASYSGDTYFAAVNAGTLDHEVERAETSTTLAAISPAPLVGQPITLSAAVSVLPNGSGTPTGPVLFTVDGVALAATAFDGVTATLEHAFWTPGAHTVSVGFSGDARFAASSDDPTSLTVEKAATSLTLAGDVNPAVFGQAVTVSATLAVVAPGAGVPTGNIEFSLDGAPVDTVAASGGVATLALGELPVGDYELTARYSGDQQYTGVEAEAEALVIAVQPAATVLTLSADRAETSFGQTLTLSSALSVVAPGAGVPSGSVTFAADGVDIGSAPLNAAGTAATLVVPEALAVGARQLTASYAGNVSFGASASSEPLAHTVLLAPVGIVLDVPADSVAEQDATFVATVQPLTSTGHVPSGFVQFFVDGKPWGKPVPVGGASARAVTDVVTASITTKTLPAGDHVITASYLGDGSFATADATSTSHTVKPASPIDPTKPVDPMAPVVPQKPTTPSAPAGALATTGLPGMDTGFAAALLLLAGLGMLGVGGARLRRRSA